MKNLLKTSILITFFLAKFTCSFSQEKPIVEWQIQKDYISHDEIELTLSFVTEKGWTVYAINPDTLDMNLSIKVNFKPDDSYALVGELTQQNAINTFDKDLNLNISYFLEKGILKQRIKKYKPCSVNLKIIC